MLFKNPETNGPITLHDLGLIVPSGAVVEIDDAYCEPQFGANGTQMPSVLEDLCGGKNPFVPYTEEDRQAVVRAKAAAKSRVVSGKNLPPGVRDMILKGQAED